MLRRYSPRVSRGADDRSLPESRTHVSDLLDLRLRAKGPQFEQRLFAAMFPVQPDGFWYGFNDEWLRWDRGKAIDKYEYSVDLGSTPVRRLTSRAGVEEFTTEFRDAGGIDWNSVARTWSGVELIPYDSTLAAEINWYNEWHCACGVVWRPSPDMRVKLVGRIDAARLAALPPRT
jgi:hypothetical protein